jgi:hypothetical protein
VQRAYNNLREQGRQDGRGPLSPTTLLYYHRVLHRALAQAVKWGLVGRNVADAVEVLRAHRAAQGQAPRAEALVIARPDGSPWWPDSFSSRFRQLAQRAGFAGVHFHLLRHAHASYLLRQKIELKVVSARLGHSTTKITADLYQHVLEGMDEEAAGALDAALRAAGAGQDAGDPKTGTETESGGRR